MFYDGCNVAFPEEIIHFFYNVSYWRGSICKLLQGNMTPVP
jgi:hypothetical protein